MTDPHAGEVWRLSPRHPGYLVSDHGRVRRIGGGILRPQRTTRGYLKVHLGRRCQVSLHVLVAETFHGPRPLGHHADHLDYDRHNNRAENLRWLPALVNSVRWAGREGGRNVWETPDDVPVDYVPLSEAEEAAYAEQVAAAGWAG